MESAEIKSSDFNVDNIIAVYERKMIRNPSIKYIFKTHQYEEEKAALIYGLRQILSENDPVLSLIIQTAAKALGDSTYHVLLTTHDNISPAGLSGRVISRRYIASNPGKDDALPRIWIVANKPDSPIGCLVHELTHFVMDMIYNSDAVPFEDDDEHTEPFRRWVDKMDPIKQASAWASFLKLVGSEMTEEHPGYKSISLVIDSLKAHAENTKTNYNRQMCMELIAHCVEIAYHIRAACLSYELFKEAEPFKWMLEYLRGQFIPVLQGYSKDPARWMPDADTLAVREEEENVKNMNK